MIIGVASCSTEPEPLHYGTDVCHFCKMTLVDNKFGAELVTKNGKAHVELRPLQSRKVGSRKVRRKGAA